MRWAGVGSTGWAQGLDVGSAGLFWLRGVGLRKHAKLAVSSKRISESRELSWNLLFLSLPLSVWFRLSRSQAFSNDDFICLPLEGRGAASSGPAAPRYRHRNSCFPLSLLFMSALIYCSYLALNMNKWNNLRMSEFKNLLSYTHSWLSSKKFFFFTLQTCQMDMAMNVRLLGNSWWTKSKHSDEQNENKSEWIPVMEVFISQIDWQMMISLIFCIFDDKTEINVPLHTQDDVRFIADVSRVLIHGSLEGKFGSKCKWVWKQNLQQN